MPPSSLRRFGRFFVPVLAILSLVILSFLLGTAVVWFGWPLSDFLTKGFMGGQDVLAGNKLVEQDKPKIVKDEDDKTFDGFTLCTREAAPQAYLFDMKGKVVHDWTMPYRRVWPAPGEESKAWFQACHLYANGDLLVVYGGPKSPADGCGLAKLDKNSKVLWKYGETAHDAVDVGEDGNIYALVTRKVKDFTPEMEKDGFNNSATFDHLVVLSPEGKEIDSLPIWQAFRNGTQPYAPLLAPAEPKTEGHKEMYGTSVQVLSKEFASKFPLFKAGQVMVALPGIDALAVLDIKDRTVAWAARGPWLSPQGAEFQDNGKLLVYDRLGSLKAPRVLEYNPKDLTVASYYTGNTGNSKFDLEAERFTSGCCQRLPKGNMLVLTSRDGELLEVKDNKDVVWRCQLGAGIPFARRYAPDQVQFLEGGESAKPR